MSDELTPALTPDQWVTATSSLWFRGEYYGWIMHDSDPNRLEIGIRGENDEVVAKHSIEDRGDIAAVVAVANDALPADSPYKITRADVDALTEAAGNLDLCCDANSDEFYPYPGAERVLYAVRAIAAKLESLLPPPSVPTKAGS